MQTAPTRPDLDRQQQDARKREQLRRDKRNSLITAIVVGAIVLGLGVTAIMWDGAPTPTPSTVPTSEPPSVIPPPAQPSQPELDPRLPNVSGIRVDNARDRLRGWNVIVHRQATAHEKPGTVLRQTPRSGHRIAEGRRVVLLVAKAPPEPRTVIVDPPRSCDPSYPTLCIPPGAPDLDCDQVNATNFTALPPDPHGFDGYDNDGIGCET